MVSRTHTRLRSLMVSSFGLVLLTLVADPFVASAQISLPFTRKVEWNQDGDYRLRQDHGPWLIMCASFLGEGGEQQAWDLVRELRQDFNLPAYVYHRQFDYSGTVEGKGWQLTPEGGVVPHKMRHLHLDNFTEIAVLVGDFESIDERKARKTLEKIKTIRPKSLHVDESTLTSRRMGVLREIQRMIHPDESVRERGPMRSAFVTTNPMLPEAHFADSGIDHFIIDLNKDIEFTLLKCEGQYTVRVASFRGESTFQLDEIEEATKEFDMRKLLGQPMESKLAEALQNAHELTTALRERGWEAYEFHDRYESYVCVGSFGWVSQPRSDGKDEINPAVHEIMERFKARPRNVIDQQGNLHRGAMQPLALPELPKVLFDVQPIPVQVPNIGQVRQAADWR